MPTFNQGRVLTQVSLMITKRSRWPWTSWIISLGNREIGVAEGICIGKSKKSDNTVFIWFSKGAVREEIEYCLNNKKPYWVRAIQGHSGVSRNDERHTYSVQLEGVFVSQRNSWSFQPIFGSGILLGWKEIWQSSTSSHLHTSGSIRYPDEEKLQDDHTAPQRVFYKTTETQSRCSILDKLIQSALAKNLGETFSKKFSIADGTSKNALKRSWNSRIPSSDGSKPAETRDDPEPSNDLLSIGRDFICRH